MSKRATIIYLCIAPVLFLLSWYIAHRMYTDYLQSGIGVNSYRGKDYSLAYAIGLTTLYLAFLLVIRDLYRKR